MNSTREILKFACFKTWSFVQITKDSELQLFKDSCRVFKCIKLLGYFWRWKQWSNLNICKVHNLHKDSGRILNSPQERFKYLWCFKWSIEDGNSSLGWQWSTQKEWLFECNRLFCKIMHFETSNFSKYRCLNILKKMIFYIIHNIPSPTSSAFDILLREMNPLAIQNSIIYCFSISLGNIAQ